MNKLADNLKNLALIPGLAGHEQKVSNYMKSYFEQLDLPVKVDVLGNTIATVQELTPVHHQSWSQHIWINWDLWLSGLRMTASFAWNGLAASLKNSSCSTCPSSDQDRRYD